jgi:hypothetical protein
MIGNFNQYINEGAKRVPHNLLNTPMLFKNLDAILKAVPMKDESTIDLAFYKEYISYAAHNGKYPNTWHDATMLYCFLEAWDFLKNIKMNYDLCMEMYNEINSTARYYRGSARDYAKKQDDFKHTMTLCKTGVEYLYTLYRYCRDLAMTYPMTFEKVLTKKFGKEYEEKLDIASNVDYIIGINNLTAKLFNY